MKKKYRKICRYCGEEFIAGSATGEICDKPECREQYEIYRKARKRELERQRPRIRKPYTVQKQQRKPSGSLREDVMRAEELGLSYGQYKGLYQN